MATSQEKITVYSLPDLKNTSDDAIPNYLNSLKFKQSHYLTDVRLALGYAAFVIAAACFMWDYKFGFESTKYYTAVAVASYAVLNGALTFWIWAKERGIVYIGTSPSGETITIATSTQKHIPVYHLTVTVDSPGGTADVMTLSLPFASWFDAAGHFVAPPFQTALATAIPAIGRLDPKRAIAPSEQQQASAGYTPEILDALATGAEVPETTAKGRQGSGNRKGGKRRNA